MAESNVIEIAKRLISYPTITPNECGIYEYISEVLKDFNSLENCIKKVDSKLLEVIERIDDFNTIARLEFPQITFEKPLSQLILAIINHATHHRGELSAMLEILGVENDFAGMLGMDL